jgi:stage II sporulation protein D
MPSRRLALFVISAAALLGPAGASPQAAPDAVTVTTFVISGHGWGHGVGMSQWGAYGYAKHGVTFDRILAHYYPGTTLAPTPVSAIKVLLYDRVKRIVVSSPADFSLVDATGAVYQLPAGNYPLDPSLTVTPDPASPPVTLQAPLTFKPGKSALWLRNPYRGTFSVTTNGKTLSLVNSVGLEGYLRGVVSSEMPKDWPVEAVKAQAVAARSYALYHRRGTGTFDVYNDTRDQVYGGIRAETPVGDQAVAETKRQVLLYDGKVADTFFFSSSGGRTADVRDAFTGGKPIPYLVSVPDPWDIYSPYHNWGPVVVAGSAASKALKIAGVGGIQTQPATGRAKTAVVNGRNGDVILSASELRSALNLRSTWMTVGMLALSRPIGEVQPTSSVTISGKALQVKNAVLEQRDASGGDWGPGPALTLDTDGTFSIDVAPEATTLYRLSAGTIKSAVLRVPVAPA